MLWHFSCTDLMQSKGITQSSGMFLTCFLFPPNKQCPFISLINVAFITNYVSNKHCSFFACYILNSLFSFSKLSIIIQIQTDYLLPLCSNSILVTGSFMLSLLLPPASSSLSSASVLLFLHHLQMSLQLLGFLKKLQPLSQSAAYSFDTPSGQDCELQSHKMKNVLQNILPLLIKNNSVSDSEIFG